MLTPAKTIPLVTKIERHRFWSKVAITANPERCWEWQGAKFSFGYGLVCLSGGHYKAHRVSWFMANDQEQPAGVVCHTCDNPACVNPSHLYDGTQQQNVADILSRGRRPSAYQQPQKPLRRLTDAQVREIWSLIKTGQSDKSISPLFGVTSNTIRDLRLGETYYDIWLEESQGYSRSQKHIGRGRPIQEDTPQRQYWREQKRKRAKP